MIAVYHSHGERQLQDNSTEDPLIRLLVTLPRGWTLKPGQTVYLYVRTNNPWSFLQGHPFSVVWWNDARRENGRTDDEDLGQDLSILGKDGIRREEPVTEVESNVGNPFAFWLLVQPRWGFTKDLAAYGTSTKLRAVVDGPYGGDFNFKDYGHVILFAQGIGIAAQIPYMRQFFYGSLNGILPVRRISLIWETTERNLVTVEPWMTHLLTQDHDDYSRTLMLNIKLHVLDKQSGLRYGRRVSSFAGPMNVKDILSEEFQAQRGKTLITGHFYISNEIFHNAQLQDSVFFQTLFLKQMKPLSPRMFTFNTIEPNQHDFVSGFNPTPLREYHRRQHILASPLLIKIFNACKSNTASDPDAGAAKEQILAINIHIRELNAQNNLDSNFCTIAVDVFLYAWSNQDLNQYLHDFCRIHYLPVGWACQPPELYSRYQPYTCRYWEDCDWHIPTLLFNFVWQLRKADVNSDIIDDQETIVIEYGFEFNRRVSKFHSLHGNQTSTVGYIQTDNILRLLNNLGNCYSSKDKSGYETSRTNLRRECLLHNYPLCWVPDTFSLELSKKNLWFSREIV
ncbi:NADPH oxidase family protein [Aspergillus saccharolyticus JOP 1030-1]|uniref:FAD-binding 8 domain-containing protein n=1 Tax=Aspergillus saccharolyticus JOP 1030-1 TaxID=1450539 RepID=A0A318Z2Q9_9EURO|nr:hypothetical protein BP01DRAFT_307866 [Aspergillus saccharolyticus JOP 1030-1]PYH40587.1 hypothetical protein BP01DRAFT_307866 [Aspergillus saccharolyticus JOP 1030-1]